MTLRGPLTYEELILEYQKLSDVVAALAAEHYDVGREDLWAETAQALADYESLPAIINDRGVAFYP